MRSTFAIAKRIILQFAHDKRTLGLLFLAPMLVLWLLTTLLGSGDYVPRLAVVDVPAQYQEYLGKQDCTIQEVDAQQAEGLLAANQVDAVLSMGADQTLVIRAEGSDSTKTAACRKVAVEAMSQMSETASEQIKADIDSKKAEIEQLKKDAKQKQAEIKQTIEEKKAQIKSNVADAKTAQKKLRAQLRTKIGQLNKSIGQLKKTVKAMAAQLPPEAQAQFAEPLAQLDKMSIDPNSIKLPSSNAMDADIDGSFDIDTEIEIPSVDFDFSMDDYLPVQNVEVTYLHGNDEWKMFDFYGPVFIGIFLLVFVFITSGMSLVNERSAGTMTRFLATPVRPVQILGGYILGFGLFAAIQAAVVLWFCLFCMHFPNEGSIVLVILVAVMLALVSVTMGLLVSGLASNAFQVIQLMLVFVVPQILLSGLFDLSVAPGWMQALSNCFPAKYGVDALRAVMLRGADLQAIGADLAALAGFVLTFFALAALRFRKKRTR